MCLIDKFCLHECPGDDHCPVDVVLNYNRPANNIVKLIIDKVDVVNLLTDFPADWTSGCGGLEFRLLSGC